MRRGRWGVRGMAMVGGMVRMLGGRRFHNFSILTGKSYCTGSMEGEYCHCDYCKCKHGYGLSGGKGGGCGGHHKK